MHPAPGGRAGTTAHLHSAAIGASRDELLTAAVRFLDEGLRAGDLVVLSAAPETVAAVTSVLDGRAGDVVVEPRISMYGARPPDGFVLLRALTERAARAGSGRLRVVGEVRVGEHPQQWRERQRYDAAVNAVLAGAPVRILCLYDQSDLPAWVVDSARATHPALLHGAAPQPNPAYRPPADYLRALPRPREPVEDREPVFAVDEARGLAPLRHRVGAALDVLVPDDVQRGDLHLAISEVAANAFRHGVRPVSLRIWADPRRLICTVTDRGGRFDDPLAGFVPAHGDDLSRGGMGLWLARKLFDSVDLLPEDDGLTVRLSTALR